MLFIALTRSLSGYPNCDIHYPSSCEDPSLYNDIGSLLYLYYPERLPEVFTVYSCCVNNPEKYEQWVKQQFGLNVSLCRNVHIVNTIDEVEQLITQDNAILSSDLYLNPKYDEVLKIDEDVIEVVKQFQSLLDADIYIRLVQVCQFAYPSPLPLVRAILDLYSEKWALLFDKHPYDFMKAIRESKVYCKESLTNRSYRKPSVPAQRVNLMQSIAEDV